MNPTPFLVAFAVSTSLVVAPAVAAPEARSGIEEFNRKLTEATRKMDNTATVALWEQDGISLLPRTAPIVGKEAIARFLGEVTEKYPDARMKLFEMACSDIEVSGDWASEWCDEHQTVELGQGKPDFDGRGRMLLVLHRGKDQVWRLKREMWNEGLAPAK